MAATDMPDRAGPLARLRYGLRGWITGRIADSAFQSWAARFPLTRPFARSSAAQLYDIVAGFVYSQTLFACVELDLFGHLRGGPLTVAELARRLDLAPDPTERLVQAAAAIGLLLRDGDRYALGPLGAAMLGAPGVAEMVRHHRLFYADLADPVALLRGESDPQLRRFWSYVGGANTHAMTAEEAAPYSALMAASQAMVAEETLGAVPLDGIRHLADIGGGEGAFLEAAARRHPALRVTLFDLPAVCDRAEARFRVAGLSERARVRPGSFLDDPLPEDAEAISLVRVLYDHDDPVVVRILAKVHAALPSGGRLILSEPMSGGRHPTRSGDAYFGFYTLAMTTGRPRSPDRYAELLADAGFTAVVRHRTRRDFITSVMTARRP